MKGYKGFNSDLSCHDMQYEIGKTYEIEGKPKICKRGFHFCKKLRDVFDYYQIFYRNCRNFNYRYCEIEALGSIVTKGNKSCTNKIKIVRELSEKDICEILNINYDTLVKYKEDFTFIDGRINLILYGLIDGLDVSAYAKPEFDNNQMFQIRLGLIKGLDVSIYAKPDFDGDQMKQIRWGLEECLDVSIYAKPEFDNDQMSQIRCSLQEHLDVSVYAKPEINSNQMRQIRYDLGDRE